MQFDIWETRGQPKGGKDMRTIFFFDQKGKIQPYKSVFQKLIFFGIVKDAVIQTLLNIQQGVSFEKSEHCQLLQHLSGKK